MKNQKGFSLIELLIVVVIIGIIAAIAIPNLLASRRAANEGSTVSAMRTMHGANATYHATKGKNKKFAPDAAALADQKLIDGTLWAAFVEGSRGTLTEAGVIANAPVVGPKSGYTFGYRSAEPTDTDPVATYEILGAPASFSGVTATGTRAFKVNQTGVITESDADKDEFTPIG